MKQTFIQYLLQEEDRRCEEEESKQPAIHDRVARIMANPTVTGLAKPSNKRKGQRAGRLLRSQYGVPLNK